MCARDPPTLKTSVPPPALSIPVFYIYICVWTRWDPELQTPPPNTHTSPPSFSSIGFRLRILCTQKTDHRGELQSEWRGVSEFDKSMTPASCRTLSSRGGASDGSALEYGHIDPSERRWAWNRMAGSFDLRIEVTFLSFSTPTPQPGSQSCCYK